MDKGKLGPMYALKDEKIVHISEVERGLQCGCRCPICNSLLVARKGEKVAHHFAHYRQSDCEYNGESSLHFAAKKLLRGAKKMYIPAVYVEFPYTPRQRELIYESMEIDIDRVELEQHFGNIIPDIVVYSKGRPFFVEIYVTHSVDEKKLKKLKEAQISTIEIDLSKFDGIVTSDKLSHLLLDDCEEKEWVYNVKAEHFYQMFLHMADKRPIIQRGYALHVDDCPILCRVWHGKPYANYFDHCYYCEYHVATEHTEDEGYKYIYCSGEKHIKGIADLKRS